MYSAWTFSSWYNMILESGVRIDGFVSQEILRGPLSSSGWKESTLRLMFDCDTQYFLNYFGQELAIPGPCRLSPEMKGNITETGY